MDPFYYENSSEYEEEDGLYTTGMIKKKRILST
jgi:hypothetical protein